MAKYLKLLIVALFATMSFVLTSCGDDDEPSSEGDLIGTWEECSLTTVFGVKQIVQFKDDHSFIEVDDFGDGDVDIMYGKWERNGNSLTLRGTDMPTTTSRIKEITSETLVIETIGIETSYKKVPNSTMDKYLK